MSSGLNNVVYNRSMLTLLEDSQFEGTRGRMVTLKGTSEHVTVKKMLALNLISPVVCAAKSFHAPHTAVNSVVWEINENGVKYVEHQQNPDTRKAA